ATELVAVCDHGADVAKRCGERWNVEGFTNLNDLLSSAEPAVISVCTPDATHHAVARHVLKFPSVRAILCEKPIATTLELELGEKLVRSARESGKLIAVAYVRRYAESFRAVRRLLDGGDLGRVRAVSGWYGKGVLHNGGHWFDLLRMLAGEVEWVEAADRLGESGAEPSLDVTLRLRSGAVATLRATDSKTYTVFEMDLLTERGRIEIRDSGHKIELFRARPS